MKLYVITATILMTSAAFAAQMPATPMAGTKMLETQPIDHGNMKFMGADPVDGMAAMTKNTAANPYAETEMAMLHAMLMAKGTDASETWTRKMIEHHRGVITMSKIALDKAKDTQTRAMAEKIVAAQKQEIAVMQNWLKRHGKSEQ
jgi:uncharacterized protein (DUF305 family)